MIVAENDGVTHERIGTIDRRESQSGRLFCIGLARNCSIDPASVVIDRMARMKDGVLPKLEFQNSAEETRVTVVSLDNSDSLMPGLLHSAAFQSPCRTNNYRRHRSFPTTTPWRRVRLQAFAATYVRSVVLLRRTKFRDVVPQ